MFEFAASCGPISQGLSGHVHHDLVAIRAGRFDGFVRDEALGNEGESIRATGMTCMRESSIKARNIPVVCPSSLNVAVREFRKQMAASASAAARAP